jgi:tripartite-type tricarboxylate transporter receptor subunit TctC
MVHVPYKGSGAAMSDLLGGHVAVSFGGLAAAMPAAKAGKLRVLATASKTRSSALPQVPTIAESGLPGFEATFFLGLLGPLAMPRETVARLNAEMVKIVQRRDFQELLAMQGMQAMTGSPEDFAARIKSEMEKTAKVVRDSGMQLN